MKTTDMEARGVGIERLDGEAQRDPEKACIWVTWKDMSTHGNRLVLHPSCLIGGVGCNRGTDAADILDLIGITFRTNRLSLRSLRCLTSIKAKQDEPALNAINNSCTGQVASPNSTSSNALNNGNIGNRYE